MTPDSTLHLSVVALHLKNFFTVKPGFAELTIDICGDYKVIQLSNKGIETLIQRHGSGRKRI